MTSELSGKPQDYARSQSKEKEKGRLYSVISLDEEERLETEETEVTEFKVSEQLDAKGVVFDRLLSFDQSSLKSANTYHIEVVPVEMQKSVEEQFKDKQDAYLHKFLKNNFKSG